MSVPNVIAYLPSPPVNDVDVGPLEVHAYGVVIAIGVLVAVWIVQQRWSAKGGDTDDVAAIAVAVVPAGLVGARIYHVITDFARYEDELWRVVAIWEGGLGIFGGVTAGAIAGAAAARRRGLNVADLLDAAAPGVPVAQAIGRLGNWFNQELYGRPTDLPWALRIDPEHRPDGLADTAFYHPTFLYEGLWNLALAAVLVVTGRRWHLRPGQLFAGYVAGYATGRLWVESLRIDTATRLLGLRVNLWVGAAVLVAAVCTIAVLQLRARPAEDDAVPSSQTEPTASH
jgi:prolipoprotein diacylglyceryl transferase